MRSKRSQRRKSRSSYRNASAEGGQDMEPVPIIEIVIALGVWVVVMVIGAIVVRRHNR